MKAHQELEKESENVVRDALDLILMRMDAGMYYDWQLGYNNDLNWRDEDQNYWNIRDQRKYAGLVRGGELRFKL